MYQGADVSTFVSVRGSSQRPAVRPSCQGCWRGKRGGAQRWGGGGRFIQSNREGDGGEGGGDVSRGRCAGVGIENECVMCMDVAKSHAFVPCGHMCVCEGCAARIMRANKECPFCCSRCYRCHARLRIGCRRERERERERERSLLTINRTRRRGRA